MYVAELTPGKQSYLLDIVSHYAATPVRAFRY